MSFKSNHLKSRKYIEALFKKGSRIRLHPFYMICLPCDVLSSHQVLFSVSSKRVRSAVARNKLKRRMREAYRLHEHCLTDGSGVFFLIGYVYIGSASSCDFKTVQDRIAASLNYLNKTYTQRKDRHASS